MKPLVIALLVGLLLASAATASEKKDYQQAAEQNTREAYQEFLQKYPKSKRFGEAVSSALALLEQEDKLWQDILKSPTKEKIDRLNNEFPKSPHLSEANGKYKKEAERIAAAERQQQAEAKRQMLLISSQWESGRAPEGCSWRCEGAQCIADIDADLWAALLTFEKQSNQEADAAEKAWVRIILGPTYIHGAKVYDCQYRRALKGIGQDFESAPDYKKTEESTWCGLPDSYRINSRVVGGVRQSIGSTLLGANHKASWTRSCE